MSAWDRSMEWGSFRSGGGILDVFPLTEEVPVRIELWGDEVDSIRSFDAESQRSIQQMDEVTIYPAAELILTKEHIEDGILRLEAEGKKQEKDLPRPEKAGGGDADPGGLSGSLWNP